MIRKFLIMGMLLLPAQLFGQVEYYVTPYTGSPQSLPPLNYINQNNGTPLNLPDDSSTSRPIGFDFTFYGQTYSSAFISNNGLISFQNAINGCCSGFNLANPGNEYSIFAFQTDLLNIGTANPYTKLTGEEGSRSFVIGWYNQAVFADSNFRSTFEITLYEGTNNILINYGDVNNGGRYFTAGIKGSNTDGYELIYSGLDSNLLDYTAYLYSSAPPPPPLPEVLYWSRIAGENQSFTLLTEAQVRYGAYDVWTTLVLSPGTYDCSNSLFGDPLGGVVKSCEIGITEEPVVTQVNCAIEPTNPQCVIDSLTDPATLLPDDEEMIVNNDNNSNSNDNSNNDSTVVDPTIEDLLVDTELAPTESTVEETDEDSAVDIPVASQNETIDRVAIADNIKDVANDVKANELADNISKSTLELALTVASDAVSNASSASGTTESASSTKTTASNISSTVSESTTVDNKVEEINKENNEVTNNEALDILEIGRSLGQAALATTLEQTKESANESLNVAENIAISNSEPTIVSVETKTTTEEQIETKLEKYENENEVIVSNITTDAVEENKTFDTIVENVNVSSVIEENTIDFVSNTEDITMTTEIENKTETVEVAEVVVENQIFDTKEEVQTSELFVDIMAIEIKPILEKNDEDVDFVNQIIAETNKQEEQNNGGFNEDEQVTIQNDPSLANAFNILPNTTNLEILGVIGKQEDKSDAEKRAEEIVAANKEQQEEISNNYMDADQSGLIGAMADGTDVASYRTAMIPDLSSWYKPEDIYMNVVYKDNNRGMYFLEKGNTDTYKKMVEEQYK